MRELNKYLRNIFLVYNCYRLQNLNFNAYKFTHNNGKLKKKTMRSVSYFIFSTLGIDNK